MPHSKIWELKCRTHNESKTRLYSIWANMKQRCYNPKNDNYVNYGKRGITICDSWRNSYECFRDWAKTNGYEENLTIDRIDGSKGYFPDNCRWVTVKAQNNNLRTNRKITYKGETKSLAEWSKQYGIPHQTIADRLDKGYPLEMVFQKDNLRWSNSVEHKRVGTKKIIVTYQNKTQSLYDFAKELGIPPKIVASRYARGVSLDKVFTVGLMRSNGQLVKNDR